MSPQACKCSRKETEPHPEMALFNLTDKVSTRSKTHVYWNN